ncbi:MAG: hypothetical protein R3351_01825, partial [Nitrospirales bacterium]|nr:hypothetical protein [Nitrospirales bacterium]
ERDELAEIGEARGHAADGGRKPVDLISSTLAPEKALLVKQWVEKAASEGRVIPLGVWGWGTWIGLYVKQPQ